MRVLILCSLVAACSGGASSPSSDIDGGVIVGEHPDGPEFVSISVNQTELTPDDTLRVSVIVTDPDGPEDVLGGELLSPSGNSYGNFVGGLDGAYQIDLSWSQLGQTEAINESAGGGNRDFVLRFYDKASHQ